MLTKPYISSLSTSPKETRSPNVFYLILCNIPKIIYVELWRKLFRISIKMLKVKGKSKKVKYIVNNIKYLILNKICTITKPHPLLTYGLLTNMRNLQILGQFWPMDL